MGRRKSWYENHRETDGVTERRCTACGEWHPETEEYFYLHNKSKPEKGFQSECKKCAIIRSQAIAAKLPPEEIEKRRLIRKDRYENKEKEIELERSKIWFQNNKDKKREYLKEYYKKHPEQMKIYSERHRHHDITPNEWEAVKKYFNYECAYCSLPLSEHYFTRKGVTKLGDFHREHVDHQGLNDITNCVCSCSSCNSIKRTKTFEEFFDSGIIQQFTKDKYDKIIKWLTEDCFQYIEEKKSKRKYNRKKNIEQDVI